VCFDDGALESPTILSLVKRTMDGPSAEANYNSEYDAGNVRLARQLMKAINAQVPYYQEEVGSLLNLLFLSYLKASESSELSEWSAGYKKIEKTLRWIEAHLAEDISIDTVSSEAQMSRAVFTRYFKKYTDSTLADYVSNARLDKAAHLLSEASFSIAEAAHQSGHRNLGHFYKRFQKRFDLTPNRYRNLMLEQRKESSELRAYVFSTV